MEFIQICILINCGLWGNTLDSVRQKRAIKDIIISVDEKIDSTQCKGRENCNEGGRCITHNLWESLNNKILTYLDELTLEKLMESQVDKIENHTQNISLKKANLRIAKGIT